MKRKLLSFLSASVLMFTLIGCGSDASKTSTSTNIKEPAEEAATEATLQSDAGSENNSADKSGTANNADAIFEYNGNSISVLNDVKSTITSLGTPIQNKSADPAEYIDYETLFFGSETDPIEYGVFKLSDGSEVPYFINVYDKNIKTSKGIGIGNTEDEILSAYGEPSDIADFPEVNIYDIVYDLEGFSISFSLDENKKVSSITYLNADTDSKYVCS